jgi:hypothetical protein
MAYPRQALALAFSLVAAAAAAEPPARRPDQMQSASASPLTYWFDAIPTAARPAA